MDLVGTLPHKAFDCVVAGRHRDVHDFRQQRVGHVVRREVGQGAKAQLHDAFDVRLFKRAVGMDFYNAGLQLSLHVLDSDGWL